VTRPTDHAGFTAQYGEWAVIAGASEGVGASLADQLAERGLNLFLIARNEALLNDVATRLRERHRVEVRPLVLDLTDPDIGAKVAVATAGTEIGLLIYNAGGANRTTTFLEDSYESSLQQIQLVCIGPLALARHFAPQMKQRGRGGIVLIGSLACLVGAAHVVVYSAVKAFDVNFAEGLWAELAEFGVDVSCMPLGTVYTPALAQMGVEYDPARDMRPEEVALEIIENIGNGPTHVVGEANRARAAGIWPADRRLAVEAMSAATRQFATGRTAHGPPPIPTAPYRAGSSSAAASP
jgi:uncharacterized protein